MDLSSSSKGSEESEVLDAQIHLYKHMFNWMSSMALNFAVEFGISDIIHSHGKPITLPGLASAMKLHPSRIRHLHAFMRLLTHNGFFSKSTGGQQQEEAYALTPPSKLLIRSNPTCLSPMLHGTFCLSPMYMWHSPKKWLTGDKEDVTLFESATGETAWDFLNKEPAMMSIFHDAMAAESSVFKLALNECAQVFQSLGDGSLLVDVGGGTGETTKLIREAFPHLKCTVFDLPQVVANSQGNENLNFVGGDMFKSIPPADAVLLKWVLHNWNDELALQIFKNCKEAISGRGNKWKVIIIDVVIDEAHDDRELTELKFDYDLAMLTLLHGKEREKKEWEKLIYEAGFSKYTITSISGFKSLIEIYP